MATSNTYDFNPSLGEIVLFSYNTIGVRPTALLQEHLQYSRTAANMMLSRWSNQGVNLWAVDLVETPLIEGVSTYDVDPTTIMILDGYVNAGASTPDRIVMPISRTEYASYPNKQQQGFTTVYWFDRLLSPTITLWPVPDGTSITTLKYYRVRQIQDADIKNGTTLEIPYAWMEAFADGLTYRLAKAWNPAMAQAAKMVADESYDIAASRNVEAVPTYISPMVSGYFRQ